MNYYDRLEIIELVRDIKELQSKISEGTEHMMWYNDVMNIINLTPSEEVYNQIKEELPKLRIKIVETENRLEEFLDKHKDWID